MNHFERPPCAASVQAAPCPKVDEERDVVRQWHFIRDRVERDPILRLHCATLAPSSNSGAETSALHALEPTPIHPKYPSGTRTIRLRTLTSPLPGDGERVARVFHGGVGRGWDELTHFVAYLARPLVKTVRVALDRHGVALLRQHEDGLSFELSPDGHATGRLVLRDFDSIRTNAQASSAEASETLAVLRHWLRALTTAFVQHARSPFAWDEVERAVTRAARAELRFLRPDRAALLQHDVSARGWVHATPDGQDEILRGIVRRVEESARKRAHQPHLPLPAVVIDLDLCGMIPRARTLAAARNVGRAQAGAPDGITELLEPETLAELPVHHEAGWLRFLSAHALTSKYPDVDWPRLREQFEASYFRPWEQLRQDTWTPGLVRFAQEIVHAGGEVVFCTGRRERVRAHTEYVLARAGLFRAQLLMMPDERTRPVAELKVEHLQRTALEIVAVFDDLADNRAALARAFPLAIVVAVTVPGFACEPLPEGAIRIASFETRPRVEVPLRGDVPAPTDAQSLGKLPIQELYTSPMAADHGVHLSEHATRAIVLRLVERAEADAIQTARNARERWQADRGDLDATQRSVLLLHHVLTRKQFYKGPRANYPLATAMRDMGDCVRRGLPIRIVMLGFPVKHDDSGLKAFGPLPDFAEAAALVRLQELQKTVQHVYEPGARITVLTDAHHFRPRSSEIPNAYQTTLRTYLAWAGIRDEDGIELRDIDELAEERWGAGTRARRHARIQHEECRLRDALHDVDPTSDPLGAVRMASERAGGGGPTFEELFLSLVHSIPIPARPRTGAWNEPLAWAKALYADPYHLTDPDAGEGLLEGRRILLRTAWEHTIRYMAAVRANQAMPTYGEPISPRVRLASVPRVDCCGYLLLGGTSLLPWHGTGAVDARGYVSTEFAISLLDQGFVPVHSPILGPHQPWMMVPATATRVGARGQGAELEPAFVQGIRLRRK